MNAGTTLHALFAAQAASTPERIAVTAGDRRITYAELDSRADAVAGRLAAAGVGRQDLVGLCMRRDIELIVGMLGILKAGAAYLPIDPEYPAERVAFLLTDGGVRTVVAGPDGLPEGLPAGLLDGLPEGRRPAAGTLTVVPVGPDDPAAPPAPTSAQAQAPAGGASAPDDLAYVIYTSGSTGTPKGVLVEHRQVVGLFEQTRDIVHPTGDDVWTMFHSVSFDFSVWEIWGALLYGGRLVLVSATEARSPQLLRSLLIDEGVTVLSQTPSAFVQFIAAELAAPPAPLALRLIVFGGERLEVKPLAPWLERFGDERPVLLNMYGITETTVHVTYRRITRADVDAPGVSPIGVPLPRMTIDLLDPSGAPVPDGTPGEMWVGGSGVARGYHQRPRLTAERFVVDGTGATARRRYRSGDSAVRAENGEYLYLGRIDDQLKVRGFRIEPGEVEAVLVAHPAVATAVVTAEDFGDGDVRLIAHIVPLSGRNGSGDRAHLVPELTGLVKGRLPEHLRPSTFHLVDVDALPLTPQGKVDRAALGVAAARAGGAAAPKPAADSSLETVLRIVRDVLRQPQVDVDDDFFDRGATSLALMRILTQVNLEAGTSLTGAELPCATARALATCVDEAHDD